MEGIGPTSFMREKVSKKKIRYRKDGFDLDLTYITDRIVALGFPSVGKEAMFRNPLPQVYKFFEHYHKDHYKLYNLCAERRYDVTKFHSRVAQYPFYDHNAPPLGLVAECCKDIHEWLSADKEHVVGINCKAGKGRTGLIICCYLLFSKTCATTDEALKLYGEKRTKNGKGVTIASQQRYIRYYEKVLNNMNGVVPKAPKYSLDKLEISVPPKTSGIQYVTIEIDNEQVFKSESVTPPKKGAYDLPIGSELQGDCKIQIWVKPSFGSDTRLCHFWLNTGFIPDDGKLSLEKDTIDVANKDRTNKTFKSDFAISAFFKGPVDSGKEKSDEDKKEEAEGKSKEGREKEKGEEDEERPKRSRSKKREKLKGSTNSSPANSKRKGKSRTRKEVSPTKEETKEEVKDGGAKEVKDETKEEVKDEGCCENVEKPSFYDETDSDTISVSDEIDSESSSSSSKN